MNDMQTNVNELNALVATFNEDYNDFNLKGHNIAASRARKGLSAIAKLTRAIRVQIQEVRVAAKAAKKKAAV